MKKAKVFRIVAVAVVLAGAGVAGYFVLHRATGSSSPLAKQSAASRNPSTEMRSLVEGLSLQGVVRVKGRLAVVVAGRVITVGQPVDSHSAVVLSSVEHEAVVGGPPSRVVVWFENKTGDRVSRVLTTSLMLQ